MVPDPVGAGTGRDAAYAHVPGPRCPVPEEAPGSRGGRDTARSRASPAHAGWSILPSRGSEGWTPEPGPASFSAPSAPWTPQGVVRAGHLPRRRDHGPVLPQPEGPPGGGHRGGVLPPEERPVRRNSCPVPRPVFPAGTGLPTPVPVINQGTGRAGAPAPGAPAVPVPGLLIAGLSRQGGLRPADRGPGFPARRRKTVAARRRTGCDSPGKPAICAAVGVWEILLYRTGKWLPFGPVVAAMLSHGICR